MRRRDDRGRRVHAAGRSSASAAAAGRRSSRSTSATARTSVPTTCRPSSRSCAMAAEHQLVFAGVDDHDLTRLSEYESIGGYQSLAKARAMEPQAVIDDAQGIAASRAGRRVLRHRAEVELHPQARREPEPALRRHQRRRVGARQLQGQRDPRARPSPVHRGHADHGVRGRVDRTPSSTSAVSTRARTRSWSRRSRSSRIVPTCSAT